MNMGSQQAFGAGLENKAVVSEDHSLSQTQRVLGEVESQQVSSSGENAPLAFSKFAPISDEAQHLGSLSDGPVRVTISGAAKQLRELYDLESEKLQIQKELAEVQAQLFDISNLNASSISQQHSVLTAESADTVSTKQNQKEDEESSGLDAKKTSVSAQKQEDSFSESLYTQTAASLGRSQFLASQNESSNGLESKPVLRPFLQAVEEDKEFSKPVYRQDFDVDSKSAKQEVPLVVDNPSGAQAQRRIGSKQGLEYEAQFDSVKKAKLQSRQQLLGVRLVQVESRIRSLKDKGF